ncbi:hypothetical protein TNCV_4400431 [Trichonephila clavipes]|nr:hypothetical protein TNCV_4400431 [Trichonephila clavipes]
MTHGPLNSRNRQTARIFKDDKSMPRIHGLWTKYIRLGKLQMAVSLGNAIRKRRLSSQRHKTLDQIITHLNDGASRKVSKWTVRGSPLRMCFGCRRSMRSDTLLGRYP